MDRLILEGITMPEFVKEVKRRHAKSPADVSSVLFSMVDSRIQDALDITRNNVDEILANISNKWKVNESTDNFFVPGHEGYWYVIDSTEYRGHRFYLMEHEEYGDDAACVAVDKNGTLVAEDLWNGFDEGFEDAADEYLSENSFTGFGLIENDESDYEREM